MKQQRILIFSGLVGALAALGYVFAWVSPGPMPTTNWGAIVFEGLLLLFVFLWNLAMLPHWQSSKTLCLGSLLLLIGNFADLYDDFFIQPRWEDVYVEKFSQALGTGLIALGIWFWVREKERLLNQLQKERDFEASLIPKLSHDLRAPLTNLCGMTSVAEEDPRFLDDPKHRQEYLEVMWRGAQEMCLLIDNILESHRLKSGTVELKTTAVSLRPLLDEACKDFYYQTKKKQITIDKESSGGDVTFEADQLKVVRIVQNLLANAIRFSPQGGRITLSAAAENGEVTIRVADQGPGMDADQIAMILRDAPLTKKQEPSGENKGYGIGLKVVKEFVQLHGGRFWIEPNIPAGSKFCVTLPKDQSQRQRSR